MSYTVDVPRTEHQITLYRSMVGAITGVFAVLSLSSGITVQGVGLVAITLWFTIGTTWAYYSHALVALALAGCAAHAALYEAFLRPAGYALGILVVAGYWRYYR